MTEHEHLFRRLEELRSRLDRVWAKDTAVRWTTGHGPAGHCAAVALILHEYLGGEFVSTSVSGLSHWFNRISNNATWIDVDITGDQFYGPPVRIGEPGKLWDKTRCRSRVDINQDTVRRSALLKSRLVLL